MPPLNVKHMRSALALSLAALLIVQSVQAQQPSTADAIRQSIAALPPTAHVAVHLNDGNTLHGRIWSRADQDFVLNPDNGGAPRTIAYAQVTTLKQVKTNHSKTKWIIIGAVAGAAVVVAVVGILAAHHGW